MGQGGKGKHDRQVAMKGEDFFAVGACSAGDRAAVCRLG